MKPLLIISLLILQLSISSLAYSPRNPQSYTITVSQPPNADKDKPPRTTVMGALTENWYNTWGKRFSAPTLKGSLNFLYDRFQPLWGKKNKPESIAHSIDVRDPIEVEAEAARAKALAEAPDNRQSSGYTYSSSYSPYSSGSPSYASYPSSYGQTSPYRSSSTSAYYPSASSYSASAYPASSYPTSSYPAAGSYGTRPATPAVYSAGTGSAYYKPSASYASPTYAAASPAAASPYAATSYHQSAYARPPATAATGYYPQPAASPVPLYPPPPPGSYPAPASYYPTYAMPPPGYPVPAASTSSTSSQEDKSSITIGGIGNIMKMLGGITFDGKNIKLNTNAIEESTKSSSGANPFIKIGELGKISLNPSASGMSISFSKEK